MGIEEGVESVKGWRLFRSWSLGNREIEHMIEELLAELFVDVVGEDEGVVEGVCPKIVFADGVIGGGEESSCGKSVEGGDETRALEETEEGLVVGVCAEDVGDGRRESEGGAGEKGGEADGETHA